MNCVKLKHKIICEEPCRYTFSSGSDRKVVAAQNPTPLKPWPSITMPLSQATTATAPFH